MESLLDPYFYAYNPELLAFENAWVNFTKNGQINLSVIKSEVADSWLRCKQRGMDPTQSDLATVIPCLSPKGIEERIQKEQTLFKIADPFMEAIYEMVKGSGFVIEYYSADGCLLKALGDPEALAMSAQTRSVPGSNFQEKFAGTSSVSLALITKQPVQVAGAEHYFQAMQYWTGSAAPVLDKNGNILCVINACGRYEMIHQHTLGMVSSAAKAIENEYYIHEINEELIEKNNRLQATTEIVSEGIVYISDEKIIQINRYMCEMLGTDSDALIGYPADAAIRTTPDIANYSHSDKQTYENEKLTLHGSKSNLVCFLNVQSVKGEFNQEIGRILIFKRQDEIKALASKIKYQAKYTFDSIIGDSPAIRQTKALAQKAAEHNVRVIIEGESGTGKEMFAQAIHNQGVRKEAPFIAIDCGAMPVELLESELFGYEGGAFTGAKKEGKLGVFELANGGTILLDEIGNMHVEMQQKLLRALQENVITRVGGTKQIPIDVRVIAATNVSLEDRIADGTFRQDLYYRLNVIQIKVPSLRERREDIPLIVNSLFAKNTSPSKRKKLDTRSMNALVSYDWPGNVRQLINTIEYAIIMSKSDLISTADLPSDLKPTRALSITKEYQESLPSLKDAMGSYVKYVVDSQSNISKAAKILGISRSTVYKFLESGDDYV